MTLAVGLEVARAPYDRALVAERAERKRDERALADPTALRTLVRAQHRYPQALERRLGAVAATALDLLVGCVGMHGVVGDRAPR